MAKIKFRTRDGKLYNVKDAAFVEICDDSNNVACLVYITDAGMVHVCSPNDDKFKRYLAFYHRKASPTRTIDMNEHRAALDS